MDRMEATVTEKTDETALSSYVVLPDFDVTRMREAYHEVGLAMTRPHMRDDAAAVPPGGV